jgi:hypothetical protein
MKFSFVYNKTALTLRMTIVTSNRTIINNLSAKWLSSLLSVLPTYYMAYCGLGPQKQINSTE